MPLWLRTVRIWEQIQPSRSSCKSGLASLTQKLQSRATRGLENSKCTYNTLASYRAEPQQTQFVHIDLILFYFVLNYIDAPLNRYWNLLNSSFILVFQSDRGASSSQKFKQRMTSRPYIYNILYYIYIYIYLYLYIGIYMLMYLFIYIIYLFTFIYIYIYM